MLVHPSLALPPPLFVGLPPSHAHALAFLFTTTYVGSIYLSQRLFPPTAASAESSSQSTSSSPPAIPPLTSTDDGGLQGSSYRRDEPEVGSRDHPDTIRLRMKAVGLATLGSLGGVWWVVRKLGHFSYSQALRPTLRLLGIPIALSLPSLGTRDALPYVLAPTLLFGPLVAMYLDRALPLQGYSPESVWSRARRWWKEEWGLVEWRNYIIGPLTEELTFRSVLLSLSLLSKASATTMVFLSPLWFGVAHAHHALEVFRKNGRNRSAAVQALAGSAFQLTYTTLFGWFASYLFIRTGSILPPLIAHVYCNVMGIYLPTTAIDRHSERKGLIWVSYLLGIVGFGYGVSRL